LIFAAPFIAFLPSVKTVNNVDYFTLTDDPDVEFYDQFKEVFGFELHHMLIDIHKPS
jgi:hypothetical protein